MGPGPSDEQWATDREVRDREYLFGYFSTPLVGDGRVYTAMRDSLYWSESMADPGHVVAYDDEDGTEAWRVELPRLAGGSPALADDRMFVGDTSGTLHSVSTDGDRLWTHDLGSPVRGCTVAGDHCYVVDDSATLHAFTLGGERCLYRDRSGALDGLLGGTSFQVDSAPAVDSSGVYASVLADPEGSRRARLLAYEHDGTQRWSYGFPISRGIPNTPAVVDDLVLVTAGGEIHAVEAATGERRWRFVTGSDTTGAPASDGERAYVGAKNLYALSLADGHEQWRVVNEAVDGSFGYEHGVPFIARPAVTDDAVYLRAGAFDPTDGSRLWGDLGRPESEDAATAVFGQRPLVSPAVTADALYLAHQQRGVLKLA
ncbi:PQQ-like beta-propeller repeat protein [Haloarchaeobius iranensis]|uniref:PQQ-like beta-propeller repeat protein n=1 Tax=Haloarchaeobius iranensis TaxID=996166 RepID=UPI00158770C6|nr:PQQ-like beta-propeller repeat protein [Haloarchaeobius iranensis]